MPASTTRGESLEYKEASGSLAFTFGLALLVVYLVLAAQFESFVHPLVILVTVPLAVTGALLGLYLTGSTMNIYSQIGIVMLVGIAAKNGGADRGVHQPAARRRALVRGRRDRSVRHPPAASGG